MNNIEILEDYIKLINKGYCEDCNELCNIYGAHAFPSKEIARTIENLMQENKELKENLKIVTAMLTKGTYPEEKTGDNVFQSNLLQNQK